MRDVHYFYAYVRLCGVDHWEALTIALACHLHGGVWHGL